MKPTAAAARPGPEPLARQHHPHDARRRHARRLHRGALGHRPHLQPDDLRQGDLRRRRLRRADRRAGRDARRRRGDLLRAGARRPARRHRPLRAASTSAPPASTASARSRSRRSSPTTPRRRSSRRRSCTAKPSRDNLFIKIPGTPAGLPAIEESIFAGIPVNVTLLFSREHYLAAADAYMKGIERRIEAGLDPDVASVASIFMSRWDVAVADEVPDELRDRLGIAIGLRAYAAYRELLDSDALAAADERGRAAAAAALGEHRDQGPRRLRRPLRRGLRLAVHGQHDARGRPCTPSPTTARSATRCRPTAATAEQMLAALRRGRDRRRRARRAPPGGGQADASSSPGKTCWRRSRRSSGRGA